MVTGFANSAVGDGLTTDTCDLCDALGVFIGDDDDDVKSITLPFKSMIALLATSFLGLAPLGKGKSLKRMLFRQNW